MANPGRGRLSVVIVTGAGAGQVRGGGSAM